MMSLSQCVQTPQHHVTQRHTDWILIDGLVPTWCNCNVSTSTPRGVLDHLSLRRDYTSTAAWESQSIVQVNVHSYSD